MRFLVSLGLCAVLGASITVAQHHENDEHHSGGDAHAVHFIDAFYTGNAFLQRKIRPDLFYSAGDHADVLTVRVEGEWAGNARWSLLGIVPVHRVSGGGHSETGVGDAVVGLKYAVANDPARAILALGGEVVLPTGDEHAGLGADAAAAAPFVRLWLPLGSERLASFQAAAHVELPLGGHEHAHGALSAALTYALPSGLSPLVELLAEVPLEGGGDVSWLIAPGARWDIAPGWQVGAALRLPMAGPEHEDYQLVVGAVRHFPMPH